MKKKSALKKIFCKHDYNNAVPIGKVDHLCPLCKELIDPSEWFFITFMESNGAKFVEVKLAKTNTRKRGKTKSIDGLSEEVLNDLKPKLIPKTLHVSPKAHHYDDK